MSITKDKEISNATSFAAVIPKDETGSSRFLKQYPEYDGRGVVIAVFDQMVDPGAAGLQVTSDGKPKILDIVDAAGCGDVDTSTVVEVDENYCIKSSSGRILKLNPNWKNPSGKWHIGSKQAFEILPNKVIKKIKAKRLEIFEDKQKTAVAKIKSEIQTFEEAHPSPNDEQKKWKNELTDRATLLQSLMEGYKDSGPLFECVVWHDGENWCTALDTSDMHEEKRKGMIENYKPIKNYRINREYATFSALDACNYCCNVYENGNILSIAVCGDSHGTHVAGIIAAYHPEDPEHNGIAPGAQIISCQLGDTRLDTMETTLGMVRSAIAAVDQKVDMVNQSYGEYSSYPLEGRAIEMISELVFDHNIVFCTSAGNNGPCLTTSSSPSDCDAVFSIGAYVSPKMSVECLSMRKELDESGNMGFTSRGPTLDNSISVTAVAPGSAISTMPQWSENVRKLKSGTSMASPNATGNIALILSGLKQNNKKISINKLKRAIINTSIIEHNSSDLPPTLSYGNGLIQIDEVWKYLEKNDNVDLNDIRYEIKAKRSDSSGSAKRGIYLREHSETSKIMQFNVQITPKLHKDADVLFEKLSIEEKLELKSTVDWVKCPKQVLLTYSRSDIDITVDPTGLTEGPHYGEIRAYDTNARQRGIIFQVPITVLKSIKMEIGSNNGIIVETPYKVNLGKYKFENGTEKRFFIDVPLGATWAELTYCAGTHEGTKSFLSKVMQLLPETRQDTYGFPMNMILCENEKRIREFPVLGGRTLEIAMAQNITSIGQSELSIEIEFHGVQILEGNTIVLDGTNGNKRIYVTAPIGREIIRPNVKLDTLCIPLRPIESKIVILNDSRDTLPNGHQIYKLDLTYKLTLKESGVISPILNLIHRQIYDCILESQTIFVYDENKKMIFVSDAYPESKNVKKGTYTFIAMLRHDDIKLLEKLQSMPLMIEKKLQKEINVPIYEKLNISLQESNKFKGRSLCQGETIPLVIGPITEELPKECSEGTMLKGPVKLGQLSHKKGPAPSFVMLNYIIPPKIKEEKEDNENSKEKTLDEKKLEAKRDGLIKVLEGINLKDGKKLEEFEEFLEMLKEEYDNYIPLLTVAIKQFDTIDDMEKEGNNIYNKIIHLCDLIKSKIDVKELTCIISKKSPEDNEEEKKEREEAKKNKEALILALNHKLNAFLSIKESEDKIKQSYKEFQDWSDASTEKTYIKTHVECEAYFQRYAGAIKLINKMMDTEDKLIISKEMRELKKQCMEKLNWKHWAVNEEAVIKMSYH